MKFLQLSGEEETLSSPSLGFPLPQNMLLKVPVCNVTIPTIKLAFKLFKQMNKRTPAQQDDHHRFG